jgi:hypothetical protein
MTPAEAAAKEVCNQLWEELRDVIKKRFGNQISETELQIIMGSIAGLAGFYLSPLPPAAVVNFAQDVLRYHKESNDRGASHVVMQQMS